MRQRADRGRGGHRVGQHVPRPFGAHGEQHSLGAVGAEARALLSVRGLTPSTIAVAEDLLRLLGLTEPAQAPAPTSPDAMAETEAKLLADEEDADEPRRGRGCRPSGQRDLMPGVRTSDGHACVFRLVARRRGVRGM